MKYEKLAILYIALHVEVDQDAIWEDIIWMHEFGEGHCRKVGILLAGGWVAQYLIL